MATLKHIASKNSDYTAIEAYLVYQHDEFTGKQLLDEQGKPKLRESYLLDTLECGDFSFELLNLLSCVIVSCSIDQFFFFLIRFCGLEFF